MLNMNLELKNRIDRFVDDCRAAGIKATHQRMEIFRELASTTAHPDAETIYERVRQRVPAISLDTVYRNLRTLEQHGMIRNVSTTDHRSRFDADMRAHHHFVCTECGRIQDFQSEHLDAFVPPRDVTRMGDVTARRFELLGVCRGCQECDIRHRAGVAKKRRNKQKGESERCLQLTI